MKEFSYVLKDENGIHARPAGAFVKEASQFSSEILIQNGEKKADGKRLFALMGLAAKKGDEIKVTVQGDDEDTASKALQDFLSTNM